jgi:TRAP-type uncharacterized transport system substrate-binding protein
MAVTISGDGTISGATLFSTEATFSSAVSLATGSTVGGINLNGGKILQSIHSTPTASVNVTSTAATTLNWSSTVTTSSNSRLFVSAVVMAYGSAGGTWFGSSRALLYLDGVAVVTNDHIGTITNEQQVWNIPIVYISPPLPAGSHTVSLYGSVVTGGTIQFNRENKGSLVVMEIAE